MRPGLRCSAKICPGKWGARFPPSKRLLFPSLKTKQKMRFLLKIKIKFSLFYSLKQNRFHELRMRCEMRRSSNRAQFQAATITELLWNEVVSNNDNSCGRSFFLLIYFQSSDFLPNVRLDYFQKRCKNVRPSSEYLFMYVLNCMSVLSCLWLVWVVFDLRSPQY